MKDVTQHRINQLKKKQDIRVDVNTNTLTFLTGNMQPKQNDLGNKSWGVISFLINKLGMKVEFADTFPRFNQQ